MLRRTFFLASIVLSLVISTASAGPVAHAWSTSFGGQYSDYLMDVDTDRYGNVYVLGYFQGTMDLGGGALVSSGGYDVFLAKFASDGTHIWSQRFGGTSSEYAMDLDVDDYGFISIVGKFAGTADFGTSLISVGSYDIYVGRYDPNGGYMWAVSFGSTLGDVGAGVCTGSDGSVYFTGSFIGTMVVEADTLVSAGGYDIVLAGINRYGDVFWTSSFGSSIDDYPQDVAADSDDNITLVTYGYGDLDFGGGLLTGFASLDVFIAQFSPTGVHQWSHIYGGNSSDYVFSLAVDSADNILMTGYFYGTASFGGGSFVSNGYDVYIAKYDQNGNHIWSDGKGGFGDQYSYEVSLDEDDNVYIAGSFYNAADLGGGPLPYQAHDDMMVGCFDSGGGHIWSRSFGGIIADRLYGVTTDGAGNTYIGGQFNYGIDFGGGVLVSQGGSYDMALAKLTPGPAIISVKDVPGDQGGLVNLAWDRNGLDNATDLGITEYSLWRAIDAAAATAMIEGGATLIDDPAKIKSAAGDVVRAAGPYYWFQEGAVPASYLENYSAPVATLFDSTDVATDYHYFQVIAHTSDPAVFYTSNVDSGRSVDNLAPASVQNLVAAQQVAPDALALTWDPNTEPDISHYEVYRGMAPGFVADPASLLGTVEQPELLDTEWQWDSGYWYKVFAVDTHGNKSPYTMIGPDLVTGVGDTPLVSSLEQNVPNPFNPVTTIAFTLREAADVMLAVYDAAGRHVRTLASGEREARRYDVTWDGRDDAGTVVASGVYFYRLSAGSFTQTKKMVLLK